MNELLKNLDKLKTTKLGEERIRKNLNIEINDVIDWCKQRIMNPQAEIYLKGKNWYAEVNKCIITVNASTYTIITVHKV